MTPHSADLAPYLRPTPTLDFDHEAVRAYALERAAGAAEPRELAVRLFEAVRDDVAYDPYACFLSTEDLRASTTLETGRAWCVPKAVLLAAGLRLHGIPARLGFADVRNHLTNDRLRALMDTDVFAWHGYVDVLLDGRWVKATPAFDTELCRRHGLLPVEWDGRADSLLHPVDAAGRQHLDYVLDRGTHADTPVEAIRETFESLYPKFVLDAVERRRRLAERARRLALRSAT